MLKTISGIDILILPFQDNVDDYFRHLSFSCICRLFRTKIRTLTISADYSELHGPILWKIIYPVLLLGRVYVDGRAYATKSRVTEILLENEAKIRKEN